MNRALATKRGQQVPFIWRLGLACARFVMDMLQIDYPQTLQDRALLSRLNTLEDQVGSLQIAVETVAATGSSGLMTNFLQDSDLNTSDAVRRQFTYTTPGSPDDATLVCSYWYARDASTTGVFTPSDALLESPEAIPYVRLTTGSITIGTKNLTVDTSTFLASDQTESYTAYVLNAGTAGDPLISTIATFTDATHVVLTDNAVSTQTGVTVLVYRDPLADTLWNNAGGTILWGNDDCLFTFLDKNYGRLGVGNNIFVVCIVKLNSDIGVESLPDDYQLQISLYDNTAGQEKIIEGEPFDITATLVLGTGLVDRRYILRVDTPNDYFYSDVASPAVVTNTPNPASGSPGQVSVEWQQFPAATAYQLYRSDSIRGLANYYPVTPPIYTGVTNAQDLGDLSPLSGPYAITQRNMRATAVIKQIGTKILPGWNSVFAHIQLPSTYDMSLTDANSQGLRFEILDGAGAPATIPQFGILFDRIGAAYNNGGWAVSSQDAAAPGDFEGNSPDPNGTNPTGGGGGGTGGGGDITKDGSGGFLPF